MSGFNTVKVLIITTFNDSSDGLCFTLKCSHLNAVEVTVVWNQDILNTLHFSTKPSFDSHILTNLKSGLYRYLSLFMVLAIETVSLTGFLASIHTFHMLSRLCQNLDFSFFYCDSQTRTGGDSVASNCQRETERKCCWVLQSEQQASISTPITITSSGVLNEVAHGSAAGANRCSLLPKTQR